MDVDRTPPPTENRNEGQGGGSREKRALPEKGRVLGRGGGFAWEGILPKRGRVGGKEVRAGGKGEVRRERGAFGAYPHLGSVGSSAFLAAADSAR